MKLTIISEEQLEGAIRKVLDEYNLIRPMEIEKGDEEMNQKEAAAYLGISQKTIMRWKRSGKIPYEQVEGCAKIRFYKSQLKAVVQKNPHLIQLRKK